MDLQGLIRNNLSDRDPRWQKPIRSRAQYLEYKCPRPKRNIKKAGDYRGYAERSHAATRLPAESVPPGKATFTSNDVGKESQHRCSGSRALVRLAQPLLRRSVRPRLTEGTWNGQIKEKFSLFARRNENPSRERRELYDCLGSWAMIIGHR